MATGYYTIELAVTKEKLSSNSPLLQILGKEVQRKKESGTFYYTYGKFSSLEEVVTAIKELENKGIKDVVIQKVYK